jgi:hypothetical protein
MTEYAFDIKLWAVARITANSEAEARKLLSTINCIDLDYNDRFAVVLSEASIEDDGGESELFEIDGKPA